MYCTPHPRRSRHRHGSHKAQSDGAALWMVPFFAGGGEKPDPLEVESYLEELLMLCQRSEEYNAFMLDKMRGGSGQLNPAVVNTFKTGGFNQTVQELTTYYIAMEEYYMVANVAKAIQIDEVRAATPPQRKPSLLFGIPTLVHLPPQRRPLRLQEDAYPEAATHPALALPLPCSSVGWQGRCVEAPGLKIFGCAVDR